MLNKLRLLTPGPTPLPEEVKLALGRDMIHHRKSAFKRLMAEIQEKLRLLFDASTPVLPLACSGTGAMTAAVYSLFKPGQKVLAIEAGKFGQRWTSIALSRGLLVERIQVEWGKSIEPEQVAEALRTTNPRIEGVLIQACETSTGVLNPVSKIAAAMKGSDALLVVDGISAVGISPCPMTDWGIDCLLTGSQKGLMLPPGLALLALSPRAWKIADGMAPGCFYFNLPKEKENLEKGQTNFTTPVNLIFGLESSLAMLLKDGLDAVYRKQWALTTLTRAGLSALGLELLAKENFAWGLTSALAPAGVDSGELLKICERDFGVVMAGGQDQLKGKIIRVGHMGWVDWADCLAGLCALAEALKRCGHAPQKDFVSEAMSAYLVNR